MSKNPKEKRVVHSLSITPDVRQMIRQEALERSQREGYNVSVSSVVEDILIDYFKREAK